MLRRLFRPGGGVQRAARIGGAVLLMLALAWSAGLVWLVRRASAVHPTPPHADGIVALTGGADRIEAAIRLLINGGGERLLVSGIGGGAGLSDLARLADVDPVPLAARVTLGRGAASTHGNAAEAARWARRYGMRSLIVVTAAYHMPRAILEIGRALPGVTLYAAPVLPPGILDTQDWPTRSGLWLLAGEWTKLLVAELGLTAFEAIPAPHPAAHSDRAHE